jgi:hypothetical protein
VRPLSRWLGTIIVGAASHRGVSALMDASASAELRRHAKGHVLVIDPDAPTANAATYAN